LRVTPAGRAPKRLRRRRGGHRVDADQRQRHSEHRPLAAVVGKALDVAGELDEQGDRDIALSLHLDDPDSADLELSGDLRRGRGQQPLPFAANDGLVVADQREAAVEKAKRQDRIFPTPTDR
jgi:hypothetical protein